MGHRLPTRDGTAHIGRIGTTTPSSTPRSLADRSSRTEGIALQTGQSYTFTTWLRAKGTADICIVLWGLGAPAENGGTTCQSVGPGGLSFLGPTLATSRAINTYGATSRLRFYAQDCRHQHRTFDGALSL